MARPTKITPYLKSRIKELYILGYPLVEISRLTDVHFNTLYRFSKADPEFFEKLDRVKEQRFQGIIELGLSQLAQGTEVQELSEAWVEELPDGTAVKKTKTTKSIPPSVKAIEVLARKYNKIFSSNELKQINNLLITTENTVTMRELLEYSNSKDNPINVGDKADEYIESLPQRAKPDIEVTPDSKP